MTRDAEFWAQTLQHHSDCINEAVARRRLIIAMFSTVFAITTLYIDRTVANDAPIEAVLVGPFVVPLVLMAILGIVCAVRLVHIHYAMVRHGICFAALKFPSKDPTAYNKAGKFNRWGLSTQNVLITAFSASISVACLAALAAKKCVGVETWMLLGAGVTAFAAVIGAIAVYFRAKIHRQAVRDAGAIVSAWEGQMPPARQSILVKHELRTIDMCQHDMFAVVTSAALLAFSLLQTLSAFHRERDPSAPSPAPAADGAGAPEVMTKEGRQAAALLYCMGVVCSTWCGMLAYLRLVYVEEKTTLSLPVDETLPANDIRRQRKWKFDTQAGYALIVIVAILVMNVACYTVVNDFLGIKPRQEGWFLGLEAGVTAAVFLYAVFRYRSEVRAARDKRTPNELDAANVVVAPPGDAAPTA